MQNLNDRPDDRDKVVSGDLVATKFFNDPEWNFGTASSSEAGMRACGGNLADAHHVVVILTEGELKSLIEKGMDALFAPLVARLPEVTTGDVPLDAQWMLKSAIKDAFIQWLGFNYPR